MSNVCRFFLNNSCRYGNRCRYSHNVSNNSTSGSNNNPYVYIRDQKDSSQNWKKNISHGEIQEIIAKISEEAKQVEYENMWPLTCLSILRDAGNVPGWEDYSMEEIRAAAYSSKAAGRFDEYLKFVQNLHQKAKENRLLFLRPGKKAEEIIRNMFEKQNPETANSIASNPQPTFSFAADKIPAFGSGFTSATPATSPFGSPGIAMQPSASSVMATSSPFAAVNPFSSNDPSPGMFAMAARGFPQTNINQSMTSNLNETAMETATDIMLSQNATSPFQQNIVGQVSQTSHQPTFAANPSPFSAPPSVFSPFGAPPASTPPTVAHLSAVFTPMDQLTEEEIEQFKATTFSLDKLPLRPPPQELC